MQGAIGDCRPCAPARDRFFCVFLRIEIEAYRFFEVFLRIEIEAAAPLPTRPSLGCSDSQDCRTLPGLSEREERQNTNTNRSSNRLAESVFWSFSQLQLLVRCTTPPCMHLYEIGTGTCNIANYRTMND